MKINLLIYFLITSLTASFAQQQAVIQGDEMLCANGTGTAMVLGIVPYDSYQWQKKEYGTTTFVNVAGATSSTFTYDAYNYSVSYIRCQVSQNGSTFYSNELFIDSMASLPIFYSSTMAGNVVLDNNTGGFLICPGGTITNTISSGFGTVQWYKNDVAIPGATSTTYVITEPGNYYATAVNTQCPGPPVTTLSTAVTVNPNCTPASPTPVIAGDTMLCPGGNGVAGLLNNMAYDTYQWQVKAYGETEFADVAGATTASFTYDQYTYSVTQIRVKVTLSGETYYSNALSIDSSVFAGITASHQYNEDEVSIDPQTGAFLICEGDEITNTINLPYTIVQWYKDGEAIAGATNASYIITEPGEYYATGSPQQCPAFTQTLLPFTVAPDPDCLAGIDNPVVGSFALYPNPAGNMLYLSITQNTILSNYTIIDVTGKTLVSGILSGNTPSIYIEGLAAGTYIIKAIGKNTQVTKLFIKQ